MLAVRGITDEFKIQMHLVDATKHKEPSLPVDVIRKNMNKYLDEIETDRLFNRGLNDLPNKSSLTLSQTLDWVEHMFNNDLHDCLRWAFAILDKDSTNDIPINLLKQSILLLIKSHKNKLAKATLTKLLQTVGEAATTMTFFNLKGFRACVQTSFVQAATGNHNIALRHSAADSSHTKRSQTS